MSASNSSTDPRAPGVTIAAPRTPSDPATPTSALRLHVEWPHTGVVFVHIAGEVDLDALPRVTELMRQRLTAAQLSTLVVDLTKVTYCNSAALELLLRVQYRAERRNIAVYLLADEGPVTRLLHLTGMTDRFTFTQRDSSGTVLALHNTGTRT